MPGRRPDVSIVFGARGTGARPVRFIVTCEHGGNRIAAAYASLFRDHQWLLATHRGYDAGALEIGREMARTLKAPYIYSTISRLFVELNRTPGNDEFHSAIMREAPEALRARA